MLPAVRGLSHAYTLHAQLCGGATYKSSPQALAVRAPVDATEKVKSERNPVCRSLRCAIHVVLLGSGAKGGPRDVEVSDKILYETVNRT